MTRVAQHPIKAFAAALGAVAVLSIMDAVMKHLVLAIGIYSVSVWRSLLTLIMAAIIYLPRRTAWPTRTVLKIHIGRGVIVTIMAVLFFWGIGRVPLAQAISLTFIAPLLALLLAALTLGEHISAKSIMGSAAAFLGVVVIVFGQSRMQLGPEVLLGSAAIIGSALCYAVNIVMMRHQALAADPMEITFFQSVTIAILWFATVPIVGIPQSAGLDWIWLVIAALMSTAGGLLFAWAYARAEASYLSVTEYSGFLWASALGWLVFRESVSLYTVAGALMIVTGCLIGARRVRNEPPEMDLV